MTVDEGILVLAGIAVLVSLGALWVAWSARGEAAKANEIAEEANTEARASNKIALEAHHFAETRPVENAWDGLIDAVHDLGSFDPTVNQADAAPLLAYVRQRGIRLVDQLRMDELGEWLEAEIDLAVAYLRESVERGEAYEGSRRPMVTALRIEQAKPFHEWVRNLTENLRHLRRVGPAADQAQGFTTAARESLAALYERRGWGDPPGTSSL